MEKPNAKAGQVGSRARDGVSGLVRAAVLAGLVAMLTLVTPEDRVGAGHGDLGWLWYSTSASNQLVHDHASSPWNAAVSAAVVDWANNTNLSPSVVSLQTTAQIHYYSGNYGNSGWLGKANVYSGSNICADDSGITGNCNKTTNKADSAILNLNSYYWDNWAGLGFPSGTEVYHRQRTSSHEMGHVWGLSHPDQECLSPTTLAVMKPSGCYLPSSAAPQNGVVIHGITHANALYP